MRTRAAILAIVAVLCIASRGIAAVPLLLSYQGSLALDGVAASDTTLRISFAVYASEVGGEPMWSETQAVRLLDGSFAVLLGSVNPFAGSLFTGDLRYLAVNVEDGEELTPRHRIVSVAYAIRSAEADDVHGKDISPMALQLSGGAARLDSAGVLTTAAVQAGLVSADSVVAGGVAIVDGDGRWVGPAIGATIAGSVVDTIIVRTIPDTIRITHNNQWRPVVQFNTQFALEESRLVDIEFLSVLSVFGGARTRISVWRMEGNTILERYENIGNISGIISDGVGVYRSSSISNAAVVRLDAGSYRIVIEADVPGSSGSLHTGQVIARIYAPGSS